MPGVWNARCRYPPIVDGEGADGCLLREINKSYE